MMQRRHCVAALFGATALFSDPERGAAQVPPHWPGALLLATASSGGTYHAYGSGLARLLSRELGVRVFTEETEGPNENMRLIEAGQAQIAFVTTSAALEGWTGSGDWTGGRQFRAINALFPMYDTPIDFIAHQDSGITTIAGLMGRTVGVGPQGGTADTYASRMLARLGVQARLVRGAWVDLATQLQNVQIEAMIVAGGVPFPAIISLESQRAIRHLPLQREAAARLRLAMPELTSSAIPAGTYPSLGRPYETVGIYNFAVAHRDLAADLVYQIVRIVFEFHDEMTEAHPAAAATVPANFVHNSLIPWHPGAARYYESKAVRGIVLGD